MISINLCTCKFLDTRIANKNDAVLRLSLSDLGSSAGLCEEQTDLSWRRPCGVQACAGIQESAVADEATWQALLGPAMQPITPDTMPDSLPGAGASTPAGASTSAGASTRESVPAAPVWANLFDAGTSTAEASSSTTASAAASQVVHTKWPMARLDDGGRDVHQLHVRPAL